MRRAYRALSCLHTNYHDSLLIGLYYIQTLDLPSYILLFSSDCMRLSISLEPIACLSYLLYLAVTIASEVYLTPTRTRTEAHSVEPTARP
jgi:hypothetical protein